jgi:hypothetical protein
VLDDNNDQYFLLLLLMQHSLREIDTLDDDITAVYRKYLDSIPPRPYLSSSYFLEDAGFPFMYYYFILMCAANSLMVLIVHSSTVSSFINNVSAETT